MKHAMVWMDQREARVFEVDADQLEKSLVHAPGAHIHRHANEKDVRVRNHPDDEHRFFHEVARALDGHGQVLVVGPSQTKLHFIKYVHQHDHALAQRIVGVESSDHPSDGQLVAHLRHYFKDLVPGRPPA